MMIVGAVLSPDDGALDLVVANQFTAAGNPLALVELPAVLSAAQLQCDDELGDPIPMTGGIHRPFGDRVARLPRRTRDALLLAAAAGADAGDALPAALALCALDPSDLRPAERDGLVTVHSGGVSFRHPLVRSIAYQLGPDDARRAARAVLAEVDGNDDRRAWRRAAATIPPDDAVAADLDATAGRALARGAPASAARAYETAARFTDDEEARGARLARAARAAHRGGDVDRAAQHDRAARALVSNPITLGDLLLWSRTSACARAISKEPTRR